MKVPYSWLRELCPVEAGPEELAEILTGLGANVETIHRPWEGLEGVVVARVLDVRDHPNSDTLCLVRVDAGAGERELVAGVRNMRPGDVVPLAPPGARVPSLPVPLAVREIRGVPSEGMLCSPRELAISADHTGILVLPPDTPVGSDVKVAFGLDDAVLDIEVTPNRPDLLSIAGVAREASAGTGTPLAAGVSEESAPEHAEVGVTVEIADLERCPRYLARTVRGVTVGPSPIAVQARLFASGVRSVSNVVDATNYTMLELGQPLHPFDLATIEGPGIVVRRAEEGERFATLDGVERVMTAEDLMIADRARSVAIAGIMGGVDTEVADGTRDVLLESAHFERVGVLRTARRLGLRTEASIRFERGTDPEGVRRAADRAVDLMVAWAGGVASPGAVDAGGAPPRRRLRLREHRASALVGERVSADNIEEAFGRLGMAIRYDPDAATVEVDVPAYRPDLQLEIDLIEEVARVRGYDRIPSTLPGIRQPGSVPAPYAFRRRVREVLVRAGLRETWSLSFASADDLAMMGVEEAVRPANPLAADQAFLRTSLVPGLARAAGTNLARGIRSVRLFEVGRVFEPGEPVAERDLVAWVLTGPAGSGLWAERRDLDFFDAKGVLEALLGSVGAIDAQVEPGDGTGPWHPARSAVVVLGGQEAGRVGELHPRAAERLDLPPRVAMGEVDVRLLAAATVLAVSAAGVEVPRFPPVRRDLAFVVDVAVPVGLVEAALRQTAGDRLGAVELFDVFAGEPLPQGRKNVAFAVDIRDPDRTLTDEEADAVVAAIVERLSKELGAEFRTG